MVQTCAVEESPGAMGTRRGKSSLFSVVIVWKHGARA
jgi:hypothetical protein